MLKLLKEFIAIYEQTDYLDDKPEFSEVCLDLGQHLLTGELLTYYQHILLKEDCYFGNEYFNLILLPYLSEGRTPEHWALQDVKAFTEREYVIFSCTDADDIVFCDMRDEKSPVYGGSPGDPDFYKLSERLSEFLELYTALTRLQLDIQLKNNFDFRDKAIPLIERYISPSAQSSCKNFIFRE